ncbi:Uncaracterized surface protein containing fasciclin (FAS1) repeats [Spirosomataceae bacterium TFI 002]|nr:Uncaracterized surface protein containing fasciclin (FAS1) repeats [Spirosomataceae bacterium TFI 002]
MTIIKTQIMKNAFKTFALTLALGAASIGSYAQSVMVGGAEMYPTKNIVENAVNSADHTTLVAAVKAAGLVDALMGEGPMTVFAPTNAAFDKLPAGTVGTLVKPENKDKLTGILTYHVIAGKLDAKEIMKRIKKGKGMAQVNTLAGGMLTFKMSGDKSVSVTDEKGRMANIDIYDVYQSNGVIHSIDTVLLPM